MPGPGSASLRSETAVYRLTDPEMRLGRGSAGANNDSAVLVDLGSEPLGSTVGRSHARARFVEGIWLLEVVTGTRSRTMLNGITVRPGQTYALAEGDCVQLGGVRLWFTAKGEMAR